MSLFGTHASPALRSDEIPPKRRNAPPSRAQDARTPSCLGQRELGFSSKRPEFGAGGQGEDGPQTAVALQSQSSASPARFSSGALCAVRAEPRPTGSAVSPICATTMEALEVLPKRDQDVSEDNDNVKYKVQLCRGVDYFPTLGVRACFKDSGHFFSCSTRALTARVSPSVCKAQTHCPGSNLRGLAPCSLDSWSPYKRHHPKLQARTRT